MLCTFPRLSLLTIALLAGAGTAAAQTGNATPATAAATAQSGQPPGTERIEPGSDEPATRIEPRRGTRINEKRSNGQVTEIEVQSGKSRYILRPNQAAGNAQAGDAQSSAYRAPQWQVMEFDLNGNKKNKADADAAAAAAGTTAPGAEGGAAATPARPAAARTPARGAPAGKVPPATVPMTKPADIPPPPPMPTQQ